MAQSVFLKLLQYKQRVGCFVVLYQVMNSKKAFCRSLGFELCLILTMHCYFIDNVDVTVEMTKCTFMYVYG